MPDALTLYRMFKRWLEAGHMTQAAADGHMRGLCDSLGIDYPETLSLAKRLNDSRNVYRG